MTGWGPRCLAKGMVMTRLVILLAVACLVMVGCNNPKTTLPSNPETPPGGLTSPPPDYPPVVGNPPPIVEPPVVGPVAPPVRPGGKTYTVTKEDKGLMDIARKVYGDPGKYKDIAKANNIPGPTYPIKVGQVLTIP